MNSTGMPESLKLVFEHLNAVRELDRYLRKKGVEKDLERYAKDVFRPAMEERFPILRAWECDPDVSGVEWCPDRWKLDGDLYVSLLVMLPSPVDPDDLDPSVNLWVPVDWPGHSAFSDRSSKCVKELLVGGFELAIERDWDEECPLCKYVNWLPADGTFDPNDLVDRIALDVEKIVRWEEQITQTIVAASANSAGKKAKAQASSVKPRRKK